MSDDSEQQAAILVTKEPVQEGPPKEAAPDDRAEDPATDLPRRPGAPASLREPDEDSFVWPRL